MTAKPTLIAIPALCCDGDLYAGIAANLADLVSVRIVIPVAPTLAQCAARLLAQVEGPIFIMGTSFGGHVAREVALAAPERVRGVWIIGAGPGAPASPRAGIERGEMLRDGRHEEVYQNFARTVTHLPGPRGQAAADKFLEMARRSDPQQVAIQNDALVARPDRWNDLGRIMAPALLLWGAHDQFSPAADGLRMAGLMPNARYVEIADCGHLPSLEAPGETIAAARHWLMSSPAQRERTW
jgi:pimeloyl-ACP methyl ester carboxylesterase